MIPGHIVRPAIFEKIVPSSISHPRRTVVDQFQIGESRRGPAEHVRFDFIHRIPARRADQSPNLCPALTAIDLRGATNMKSRINFRLGFHLAVHLIANESATDSKRWLRSKSAETLPEVSG